MSKDILDCKKKTKNFKFSQVIPNSFRQEEKTRNVRRPLTNRNTGELKIR